MGLAMSYLTPLCRILTDRQTPTGFGRRVLLQLIGGKFRAKLTDPKRPVPSSASITQIQCLPQMLLAYVSIRHVNGTMKTLESVAPVYCRNCEDIIVHVHPAQRPHQTGCVPECTCVPSAVRP